MNNYLIVVVVVVVVVVVSLLLFVVIGMNLLQASVIVRVCSIADGCSRRLVARGRRLRRIHLSSLT